MLSCHHDRGFELLTSRCHALPSVLEETLGQAAPELPRAALDASRWVVTGTGVSEGSARMLAALLRRHGGRCAEFVPLSTFARPVGRTRAALAVFSQGISPNATLALRAAGAFDACVLITASPDHPAVVDAVRAGACAAVHPPAAEDVLLLRVLGPAAAALRGCQLAASVAAHVGGDVPWSPADIARVPATVAAVDARVRELWTTPEGEALARRLNGAVAFVTATDCDDLVHGLQWKWLEGTGRCDPPLWDVMQVAHGPYQHLYEREFTLLGFDREGDAVSASLFEALQRMLHPERHACTRWPATLPGALAFFEYDAWVNALVLRALAQSERDLIAWPGKGRDGPLYDIGA